MVYSIYTIAYIVLHIYYFYFDYHYEYIGIDYIYYHLCSFMVTFANGLIETWLILIDMLGILQKQVLPKVGG